MSERKGPVDEAIGRPAEWREDRYEKPGAPLDDSVVNPEQQNAVLPDRTSTRVTRKDYTTVEPFEHGEGEPPRDPNDPPPHGPTA